MSIYAAIAYGGEKKKYGKGSIKSFYNQPKNYDDWKSKYKKSGSGYSLKEGYISSSTRLHSGYGDPLYSQKPTGDRYGRVGKDSYGYIRGSGSSGLYIYKNPNFAQQQAAAAPAAAAPAAAPLPINNPYKAEADRLLQTIKEMEAAKPKTMISSSQAVNPSNLTIAAAGEQPKQSGSGSFKRRKATTTTANLRTINSVNI